MAIDVKICGIKDHSALDTAMDAKARWVGFVFVDRSPRQLAPDNAAVLARAAKDRVLAVGLFVDPTDAELAAVLAQVPLDMVQLHGHETPARTHAVRTQFGLPVIKAIGIAGAQDFDAAIAYAPVSDMLLFDAKPPKTADALAGGNGLVFDWTLCRHISTQCPWMLSGGLNAENVADAIRLSGALAVDVSSGVETERGVKSPALIGAFIKAAGSVL